MKFPGVQWSFEFCIGADPSKMGISTEAFVYMMIDFFTTKGTKISLRPQSLAIFISSSLAGDLYSWLFLTENDSKA